MKVLLIKQMNGTFIPAYDSDKENLKRIKSGEMIQADVVKPRGVKKHRKFFALLNLLFQNQENYKNIEDLRHDLTVAAGYYREVVDIHGEITKRAESISFAAMDDLQFDKYFDDVLNTIVHHFNFDKEEILNNISEFY